MAENITLSKAVRSNLLNLQNTADQLGKTQQRLATGLKVNSALDNPTNFFTASSLSSRASDLGRLLDSVSSAKSTIEAADKGLTALTSLVESAQATARQALQTAATVDTTTAATAGTVTAGTFSTVDVSGAGSAATAAVVSGGSAYSAVDVSLGDKSFTIDTGSGATTVNLTQAASGGDNSYTTAEIQTQVDAALGAGVVTVGTGGSGELTLTTVATGTGASITVAGTDVADLGITSGATDTGSAAVAADSISFDLAVDGGSATTITIDASAAATAGFTASALTAANIASLINTQAGATVADATSGDLVFTSATTGTSSSVAITSYSASVSGGSTGIANASDTGSAASTTTSANPKRDEFVTTYNDLLTQIDALAADASFNGVNLLNGDDLSVLFNEDGSSSLDITGVTYNSAGLGLSAVAAGGFNSNTAINATLDTLSSGVDTLRTQASTFGSNLSVVEIRQDFTKNIINTLQTGAANLTLADTNEEAANLLALQTRQQLSTTALSLASQAEQNVLRLF